MNTVKQLNEGMGRNAVAPKKLTKVQQLEAQIAALQAQIAKPTAAPAPTQTANQTASGTLEIAVLVNGKVAASSIAVNRVKADGRAQFGLYGLKLALMPTDTVTLRVGGQTYGPSTLRQSKDKDAKGNPRPQNWIHYCGGKFVYEGRNMQAGLNASLDHGADQPMPTGLANYSVSVNVTEWRPK